MRVEFPPVRTKTDMYRRLDGGEFGNTIVRWYSLAAWEASGLDHDLWAIRCTTGPGGDPRCALDVPTAQLPGLYRGWYGEAGGEISPMVDHRLTARFQVVEGDTGLRVWGVLGHNGVKWRDAFRGLAVNWDGLAARGVLTAYLNPNSLDDLDILLERYPRHAVEMTTLDRCLGTVPGRNAVIWEVRLY